MKTKILLTIASALLLTPFIHAVPAVPETGSTLGSFAVVVLAAIVLRRKFSK